MDKDKKDEKKQSSIAKAVARSKNANQNPKTAKPGGLKEYFRGVKVETKKVVWPTKKELTTYTWTVLITCFSFAIAIWLVDSLFAQILKLVLGFTF
jgi:preprotein translocase subunit SecE